MQHLQKFRCGEANSDEAPNATKNMVPEHEAVHQVIKVVKHMKWSEKNRRCFSNLCKDLGSEHMQAWYQGLWLSKGKVC